MLSYLACVNHSETVAIYECKACHKQLCGECSKHSWTPAGFVENCPDCGELLRENAEAMEAVANTSALPQRGAKEFVRRLPEFLAFSVSSPVLILCGGLAVLTAPLYWAALHQIWITMILVQIAGIAALEAAMYFRMVEFTANGKPLDPIEMWTGLWASLIRYIVAASPIILAIAWFGEQLGSMEVGFLLVVIEPSIIFQATGPAILFVIGIIILPLTTVLAATGNSPLVVLNPSLWLRMLAIFGTTYIAGAVAFYVVLAIELLLWHPILWDLYTWNPVPFVTPVVAMGLMYMGMALRARVLGGLCEPFLDDFD